MIDSAGFMETQEITERRELANRVAAGRELSASPKLRSFFLYVVDCSLREHAEEATEQQIGIKIFGRRPGYNSGDDSIVRAQARLLRQKLATYFAAGGAAEPVVIEMPKGRYLLSFHEREMALAQAPGQAIVIPQPPTARAEVPSAAASERAHDREAPASVARRWGLPLQLLMLLLLLLLGVGVGAWTDRRWETRGERKPDALWSQFLGRTHPTLVVYSNPLFRGSLAEGLRLVDPDGGAGINDQNDDTYTGTGEVEAVHTLTGFFDAHDAAFTLKRSRLLTWDQARSSNLIFVGAPSQNPALHDLPARSEFTIAQDAGGRGYIVNQHPRPGEPVTFPRNDKSQETALVALLPGMEPGTHILVVSGLTTIGTQMAVEYLCRPDSLPALVQQVGTLDGALRPFEAVLQIAISKGVGVNVQLLTVHRH